VLTDDKNNSYTLFRLFGHIKQWNNVRLREYDKLQSLMYRSVIKRCILRIADRLEVEPKATF